MKENGGYKTRELNLLEKTWLRLRKQLADYREATMYSNKVDEILSFVPQNDEELNEAIDSATKMYNFISYTLVIGMSK